MDANRTERVTRSIRDLVLSGALPPGERLHEVRLAARLGVSRTPVRETFRTLAAEGLLDHNPNCGYVVRRTSMQDILDLFDVRATLEAMACRLVAERGLDATLVAAIGENLQLGETVTAGPGWSPAHEQRWDSVNRGFHGLLLNATGNRALVEAVQQTRRLPLMHGPHSQPQDPTLLRRRYGDRAHCQRSLADHELIFTALLRRESTRAEHLMREHVYRNRDGFRRAAAAIAGDAICPA